MKEINLEEIWLNAVETEDVDGKTCWDIGRAAMLEFGKQLLELAAENATVKFSDKQEWSEFHQEYIYPLSDEVDKDSILDTINQVK